MKSLAPTFSAFLLFAILSCNAQTATNIKVIDPVSFKKEISTTPNAQILDVRTAEEFTTLFGSIDTNLEKIGMFFHRSALAALGRGPILALNVANIDANDTIEWQAPVTNGSVDSENSLDGSNDYASYFNIDKFWFPEDKATLDTIGIDNDRVLNFINIKRK